MLPIKNIAVIGYTGFIGSAVYSALKKKYQVTGYNSSSTISKGVFDSIINCAGVSSKYWTELDPASAYAKELNIITNLQKLSSSKLIHISSIDATRKSKYGCIKYMVEGKVREIFPSSLILRLPGVIGQGLKKNVVFDLQERGDIFLTEDSILNFVSTEDVARTICSILDMEIQITGDINLVASEGITVGELSRLFGHKPKKWGAQKQDYSSLETASSYSFWKTKTSRDCVLEYILEQIK